MRLSYLKTHRTPEDARAVLSLLDEIRDTLWQVYGKEITEHYQQLYTKKPHTENADLSEHQLALFAPEQDDITPF